MNISQNVIAVVPAAGVGKRMGADVPKQYLNLNGKTVIEHTIEKLLAVAAINKIVIAVSDDDSFIKTLLAQWPADKVQLTLGGQERADSVLAGLESFDDKQYGWALVHDAARPCVSASEIQSLISSCQSQNTGGILASQVKDTMKRGNDAQRVTQTVDRNQLWHAFTPQFFPSSDLKKAITSCLHQGITITDEASAMEQVGQPVLLHQASSSNIKITTPDDIALAEFYLSRESHD